MLVYKELPLQKHSFYAVFTAQHRQKRIFLIAKYDKIEIKTLILNIL